MSETQALLSKIAALRQRLEQCQGKSRETANPDDDTPGLARLWELERQAGEAAEQSRALDLMTRPTSPSGTPALPSQLTVRARKVLETARELLQGLKRLHSEPLVHEAGGLLTTMYRETTALAEAGLRLVTHLPDSPTGQLQMCEGIEALLGYVSSRLTSLSQVIQQQREEQRRLTLLADVLRAIDTSGAVEMKPLSELAEALLAEASENTPLRFQHPPAPEATPEWVARFVAGHSLTCAAVMARLVRHLPELRGRSTDAVIAALLHDVGMLRVSPTILVQDRPLEDEHKRAVERHSREGGARVGKVMHDAAWLIEAVVHHHERLDGTGYPDGLKEAQLSPLTRLLAVCDVYSAGCSARPHRKQRDTRTAMTDVLLLAEQGRLDRHFAETLLHLSFYPVGAVVEMADGSVAGVLAASSNRLDPHAPARPVVALLTEPTGQFRPSPAYLDLSHSDSHRIVRTLSPAERRRQLGTRYPEWVL